MGNTSSSASVKETKSERKTTAYVYQVSCNSQVSCIANIFVTNKFVEIYYWIVSTGCPFGNKILARLATTINAYTVSVRK